MKNHNIKTKEYFFEMALVARTATRQVDKNQIEYLIIADYVDYVVSVTQPKVGKHK